MSHPLVDLLQEGWVAESRLSAATLGLLAPLLDSSVGAITRSRSGRGRKLILGNEASLRAMIMARYPGLLVAPDPSLGPKASAIARRRNAHRGGPGEADPVLLRAAPGVELVGPVGQRIPIGDLTAMAGVASFLLRDDEEWSFEGEPGLVLATVENSECFTRSQALGVDAAVWIYTQGRMSRRVMAWVTRLGVGTDRVLVHLGDYDPVGLHEYLKLREGWGDRVRLNMPPDLGAAFKAMSSEGIMLKERNQDLLVRLTAREANLPADAKAVLALIRQHSAGLEQEWLTTKWRSE